MDLITKFMYAAIITSAVTILLLLGGASSQYMMMALRNFFIMDLSSALLVFLFLSLALLEIISYKLQGWYEGLYSNLIDGDSFNYNNKDAFPLLPEMDAGGSSSEIITQEGYLNTESLKKLTNGIANLEVVLISLIITVAFISRFPIKASMVPGQTNIAPKLIPFTIAIFGVILFAIIINSFWEIFEPIGKANAVDFLDPATENTWGPESGISQKNRFFSFTKKAHTLPQPKLFMVLVYFMYASLFTCMGLCLVVFTTNVAENSYNLMKNRAPYISQLSDDGRLIAYEFQDPLIRLIDNAIKIKAENEKDGSAVPIKNTSSAARLFDIVKLKPRVEGVGKKAERLSSAYDGEQAYLVAAVNNWTIIHNTSGRNFLNISVDNRGDDEHQQYSTTDGGTVYKKKDSYVSKKQFAWSDEQKQKMFAEKIPVQPYLDPDRARLAIYGSSQDTREEEHRGGSPNITSKVYLIPVELNTLERIPGEQRMDVIQRIVYDEFAVEIGESLEDRPHSEKPRPVLSPESLEEVPIITKQETDESLPDDEITNKSGTLSGAKKDLYIEIQTKLNDDYLKRHGVIGREYTLGHDKEPIAKMELRASDGGLVTTNYMIEVMSKSRSKKREPIADYNVVLRTTESYNIYNITYSDLIYLRYAMIEHIGFKQTDDNPTKIQSQYSKRLNYLPDVYDMIYQILPSMKQYTEKHSPEILKEYYQDIDHNFNSGKTTAEVTAHDISSFGQRFSTVLHQKEVVHQPPGSGFETRIDKGAPRINSVSANLERIEPIRD